MAEHPIGKTQQRVLDLVGLSCDGTYDHAARTLEAAGLPRDGIPSGQTWRTVAKLADTELVALLPTAVTVAAPVADSREAKAERFAEHKARSDYFRDLANGKLDRPERPWFYEAGGKVWEDE